VFKMGQTCVKHIHADVYLEICWSGEQACL